MSIHSTLSRFAGLIGALVTWSLLNFYECHDGTHRHHIGDQRKKVFGFCCANQWFRPLAPWEKWKRKCVWHICLFFVLMLHSQIRWIFRNSKMESSSISLSEMSLLFPALQTQSKTRKVLRCSGLINVQFCSWEMELSDKMVLHALFSQSHREHSPRSWYVNTEEGNCHWIILTLWQSTLLC